MSRRPFYRVLAGTWLNGRVASSRAPRISGRAISNLRQSSASGGLFTWRRRFTPAMGAKVNMARSPISGGRPRRFVRNARRSVRRQVRGPLLPAHAPLCLCSYCQKNGEGCTRFVLQSQVDDHPKNNCKNRRLVHSARRANNINVIISVGRSPIENVPA
jgi:hypothetical protein